MLDYFLQFKTKDLEHKYSQDHTYENIAIRKRAFIQIIIFCSIEAITKLILESIYQKNPPNEENSGPMLHCGFALSTLIPLCIIGLLNSKYITKNKLIQDVLCILFLGSEIIFELPSFRIGSIHPQVPWTTRLECLMSGLKCLWRVILGLKIVWSLMSKTILIITVLILELLHLRLACTENVELDGNPDNYVFYLFVTIEYIYIIVILYNEEKGLRMGFLQKYKEIKSNNTLKFILNQIPENIVIVDHYLQPKFISNSLNDLNEENHHNSIEDLFANITELKERDENMMIINDKSIIKASFQLEEHLALQIRDDQLFSQSNIKNKDINACNNSNNNANLFSNDLTLLDIIKGNKCNFTLFDYIKEKNSQRINSPICVNNTPYNKLNNNINDVRDINHDNLDQISDKYDSHESSKQVVREVEAHLWRKIFG